MCEAGSAQIPHPCLAPKPVGRAGLVLALRMVLVHNWHAGGWSCIRQAGGAGWAYGDSPLSRALGQGGVLGCNEGAVLRQAPWPRFS